MNKYKPLYLIALAVALAGGAGFLAMTYLEQKERALAEQFEDKNEYREVIVPSRNLSIGDVISADTVVMRQIPEPFVPDGALGYDDFQTIAGAAVKEPVSEGRPLLRGQIEGVSKVAKFSELLKPGQRAMTLAVSNLDTNAYMLVPGDVVDVVQVANNGKDLQATAPRLLPVLDQAVVLATGLLSVADPLYNQYDLRGEGYRTITVGVDLEQVAQVMAAQEAGTLKYLLRNPEDKQQLHAMSAADAQGKAVVIYSAKQAEQGLLKSQVAVAPAKVHRRAVDSEGRERLFQKFEAPAEGDLAAAQ